MIQRLRNQGFTIKIMYIIIVIIMWDQINQSIYLFGN